MLYIQIQESNDQDRRESSKTRNSLFVGLERELLRLTKNESSVIGPLSTIVCFIAESTKRIRASKRTGRCLGPADQAVLFRLP
jgi:hypothetical protein